GEAETWVFHRSDIPLYPAEAVEDLKRLQAMAPKDKEHYYNAGRLLADLKKYSEADLMFGKALERDKGYSEAITDKIKVLHILGNYAQGLIITQMGLDDKKDHISYYNHAVMLDSLKNYAEAEKFYKNSKNDESKFIPAYFGLALVQVKLNKNADALKTCEEGLSKDPNSADMYFARSVVMADKKDFQAALNDVTRVILSKPSPVAYKQRASYYEKLGQYQNAINDYIQVVKLDDKDWDAYFRKAAAHEQMQNYKAALIDYNKMATLAAGNDKIEAKLKQAKRKMTELSRESIKPEITMSFPRSNEKNLMKLSADLEEIVMKGNISDGSLIKSITSNYGTVSFDSDSLNPEFTLKVNNLSKISDITITAVDIYNNTQATLFKIEKTESNKPVIAIETPETSFENEIFIDNNNADIYIQGKIKDQSLIESILIDDQLASFNHANLNPDFSSQFSISNKNKLTVTVKDIYGNENSQVYNLNRAGATAGVNNPMGNTWVVFIENSHYNSFPSLEGPAKDVTAMKSALVNYKVTKIIHKKDMTKGEMEKFFSIELRDYVKNNNINSLLIWYAGHGKYVSPTGYWVPADGKTDDEFSYFGINNLKAAMQSYSTKLIHTLVITDACESGATFLMAMRGDESGKHCDNWELTKAKSSQVFTSAGYELASDNSQFSKTFAACLNNNTDACIPIEKITKKVSAAVLQAGNQSPKFGKIKDLEDEGGTYFFIKK
ncbi:MAG TPA: tetratricopeptide repeat protein, partial [Bacteroidia bacterium]|nr:tetratricopeptide repeat protein [Bacteroidia bacterium]